MTLFRRELAALSHVISTIPFATHAAVQKARKARAIEEYFTRRFASRGLRSLWGLLWVDWLEIAGNCGQILQTFGPPRLNIRHGKRIT